MFKIEETLEMCAKKLAGCTNVIAYMVVALHMGETQVLFYIFFSLNKLGPKNCLPFDSY